MNLDAYRAERLAEAEAEAAQALAEAEARVATILEAARAAAAALIARERDTGSADADQAMAVRRAAGRRDAQAIRLAARREAYEALRRDIRAKVFELRADPAYPALLDRLEDVARRQLGDGALVERDPAGAGGVVAEALGRRVDYTLPELAERSLRAMGNEVERLWA